MAMLKLYRRYSSGGVESVLAVLQGRGLLKQATRVSVAPPPSGCAVYCGFDPTAPDLHLGHLLAINTLLHFRHAGYQPIAVVGGATGRVGDPSGRVREREQLAEDTLSQNIASLRQSLTDIFHHDRELHGSGPDIRVMDNWEWWRDMSALQFVADIARQFRVKSMLAKESVQQRMQSEEGLSCAEFLYPCFQAHDFLHLHRNHNCWFQVGGGDQWGNITAGCEFVRKSTGSTVHGVTVPLLTSSTGEKLSKSSGNAVWISSSGYLLYQQLLQTADQQVEGLLHSLTFMPPEEVAETMGQHRTSPEKYLAQRTLSEHVTRLVHGEEGLRHAQTATRALFGDPQSLRSLSGEELTQLFSNAPTAALTFDLLSEDTTIAEVALKAAVVPSQFHLDRLLADGGLYLNGQRVKKEELFSTSAHVLPGNLSVFRVGKKTYQLLQWTH